MQFPDYYPNFFTATILNWNHLLNNDTFKDIIVDSLKFLVQDKRVAIFSFVIMDNHIHIIWRIENEYEKVKVQQSFLKYTAQTILKELRNSYPNELLNYLVNASDRKHQIWERNALSIEIRSNDVMFQKIKYIHENPVKAGLCKLPEDYVYSSASLYIQDKTIWNFLQKWNID